MTRLSTISTLLLVLIGLAAIAPSAEARQFKTPEYYKAGLLNYAVISGDFTHDGKLDLITGDYDNWKLYVYLGKGDGTFQKPLISNITAPGALAVGDFNGDGKTDFTGRALESGQWWTGVSNGSTFNTSLWTNWSTAVNWVDVRTGDFT